MYFRPYNRHSDFKRETDMSTENLSTFMNAVSESDDLAKLACQSMDGSNDPGDFVALGKTNGCHFSTEDVISYFNAIDGGDLSMEEAQAKLATGVAMFRRMGTMYMVPTWALRLYTFSTQADMRFW